MNTDTLETTIQQDIENNLQKRGYSSQTFGSLDVKTDWMFLVVVATILYFVFK